MVSAWATRRHRTSQSEKTNHANASDSAGHVPSEKHPMCHHRMTVHSRESYARAGPPRSCSLWEGSGSPHLRPAGAPALAARQDAAFDEAVPGKGLAINEKLACSGHVEPWHTPCSGRDDDTSYKRPTPSSAGSIVCPAASRPQSSARRPKPWSRPSQGCWARSAKRWKPTG